MSTFYDALYNALVRQINVVWPDIKAIIAVPQLQRYNWSNLLENGEIGAPVAVIRFEAMNSIDDESGVSAVFLGRVTIFFVFSIPDTGLNDQSTIYSRLIALFANIEGGGIEDAVGAVLTSGFQIDGTENNDLAALFLAHAYDLSAGSVSFGCQIGFGILDET